MKITVLWQKLDIFNVRTPPDPQASRVYLGFFRLSYLDEVSGGTKIAGTLIAYIDASKVDGLAFHLTQALSIVAEMMNLGGLACEQARTRFDNVFSMLPTSP